jgi:predicted RNA-binding protein YlxR (DUF448 family)
MAATSERPDDGAAAAAQDGGRGAAGTPEDAPEGAPEDAPETGPLRRCIATRASGPKEGMVRFVLDPEGRVVADLEARLPGRGMWLSAGADVLERATKRGAFSRAARRTVHVPPDLRARIEDGLTRRIRDLVGFARRSGQAVCGREAVLDWLRAGRVGLLVEAADGSLPERARLLGGREMPMVAPLPADTLGSLFGRDHAVHVAIAPGRLADAIAADAKRLAGYGPPAATAARM